MIMLVLIYFGKMIMRFYGISLSLRNNNNLKFYI